MKKVLTLLCLSTLLTACSDNEVGDVSLGLFTTQGSLVDFITNFA